MNYTTLFNIRAQDIAKQEEDKANALSFAGRALESGLRETNSAPDETTLSKNNDQKRKQKDHEFTNLLIRLDDMRRWLRQEMNDIQERIYELNQEIDERGRQIDAMKTFMDALNENGDQALDEDGYPKANQKAKETIQVWEQKNHKKLDLTSNGAQTDLLMIMDDLNQQKTQKADERDVQQVKWDRYNEQLEATDEMISQAARNGYANIVEVQDTQGFADLLDKFRQTEELKNQKEQLAQENNAVNGLKNNTETENTLAATTDILNSAPGIN